MRPLDARRRERALKEFGVSFLLDPAAARRYASDMEPVTDDRPALEYWGVDRVRDVYPEPAMLAMDNIAQMRQAAGAR